MHSKLMNLTCYFFFLICFEISPYLWGQEGQFFPTSKPLQEVMSLGASTTGYLIEASVGAIHKSCRHRFYCHSSNHIAGFLGPQTVAKPLTLKNQPGVYPAPSMGTASLIFTFHCDKSQTPLTPIIVRPDGTLFQGHPMTEHSSPQNLVISSPAQTGIYTLFVLAHEKERLDTLVKVNASISTQPQHNQTFHLKSLGPNEKEAELISAEFIYIPNSYKNDVF